MHPNQALLDSFYAAFQARDPAPMAAAYADNAHFSDPVFPSLNAIETRAMWRMLIERGTDLDLTYRDVRATDTQGSARWQATYTFQATGRLVTNVIDATFEFQNGRILRHHDTFSLYRWTRMALGPRGTLLGWTPLVQNKVRAMAARQLGKFLASNSGPEPGRGRESESFSKRVSGAGDVLE